MLSNQPAPTLHRRTVESNASTKPLALWSGAFFTLPASHLVFWSDSLLHAVYLKNRLWHSAIRRTPYEAYFSEKPDLSHLRVFGSLVTSRVFGERHAKLDRHTFHGIFLGYTATDLNVRYYDLTNSSRIKTARHVVFR
jgi:hypothetical protein